MGQPWIMFHAPVMGRANNHDLERGKRGFKDPRVL